MLGRCFKSSHGFLGGLWLVAKPSLECNWVWLSIDPFLGSTVIVVEKFKYLERVEIKHILIKNMLQKRETVKGKGTLLLKTQSRSCTWDISSYFISRRPWPLLMAREPGGCSCSSGHLQMQVNLGAPTPCKRRMDLGNTSDLWGWGSIHFINCTKYHVGACGKARFANEPKWYLIAYSVSIYWAPTMCQTLCWELRMEKWMRRTWPLPLWSLSLWGG